MPRSTVPPSRDWQQRIDALMLPKGTFRRVHARTAQARSRRMGGVSGSPFSAARLTRNEKGGKALSRLTVGEDGGHETLQSQRQLRKEYL
ncbi:hypothetical protein D9M72_373110 [compost metagenome]